MRPALLLVLSLLFNLTQAQTIVGKWKTIDDNTGEPRSIIELTETSGKIFGKIVKLFPRPDQDPDPVCDKCEESDPRFKKKIIGMEFIRNMQKDGAEYSGGDILDPENGKVYKSKIWLEGKDLKVRGYWGPFYRTQTWQRAE
ncbi:MAG: DUF2147 domain-containing protein [Cyclobacteriaceae bacterium]|nr:DUF2147 domain-containing protein [Cyclobacteriaceae bacterium]